MAAFWKGTQRESPGCWHTRSAGREGHTLFILESPTPNGHVRFRHFVPPSEGNSGSGPRRAGRQRPGTGQRARRRRPQPAGEAPCPAPARSPRRTMGPAPHFAILSEPLPWAGHQEPPAAGPGFLVCPTIPAPGARHSPGIHRARPRRPGPSGRGPPPERPASPGLEGLAGGPPGPTPPPAARPGRGGGEGRGPGQARPMKEPAQRLRRPRPLRRRPRRAMSRQRPPSPLTPFCFPVCLYGRARSPRAGSPLLPLPRPLSPPHPLCDAAAPFPPHPRRRRGLPAPLRLPPPPRDISGPGLRPTALGLRRPPSSVPPQQ